VRQLLPVPFGAGVVVPAFFRAPVPVVLFRALAASPSCPRLSRTPGSPAPRRPGLRPGSRAGA